MTIIIIVPGNQRVMR